MVNAKQNYKVAIVTEFLGKSSLTDLLVDKLLFEFPDAKIHTIYGKKSLLHKLPAFFRAEWLWYWHMRFKVESIDFANYDLVIGVGSIWTAGLITNLQTKQVCYLTEWPSTRWPTFKQPQNAMTSQSVNFSLITCFKRKQRIWDFLAAKRPENWFFASDSIKDLAMKHFKVSGKVLIPELVEQDKTVETTATKNKSSEKSYVYFTNEENCLSREFKWLQEIAKRSQLALHIHKIDDLNFNSLSFTDDIVNIINSSNGVIDATGQEASLVSIYAAQMGKKVFELKRVNDPQILENLFADFILKSADAEKGNLQKDFSNELKSLLDL